jgi:hypothetical protein
MSDGVDFKEFFEDFEDESMLFEMIKLGNTKIDFPHTLEDITMDDSIDVDLLLDAGNPNPPDTDVLQADADKIFAGEKKDAKQAYSQDVADNVSFTVDDISMTGQETVPMGALHNEGIAFPLGRPAPLDIHQLFTEDEIIQAALAIAQKYPVLSAPEGMYGQIQNSHPPQRQPPFQNTDPFQIQRSFEPMPSQPADGPSPIAPNKIANTASAEFHYTGDQSQAATNTGASAQPAHEHPNSATAVDYPATKNAGEVSENSSSPMSRSSSVFARPVEYTKEMPKTDPSRPHIRVNKTSGPSKRSFKLNTFNPKKQYSKHKGNVFPNWATSTGKRIEYNELGELSEPALSIGQMKRFIYEHAALPDKRMVLWIQRCPADSARRYHSIVSSKCRFLNCPDVKRTIMPGHLRVVFDEKWTSHGDKQDPYQFAGTAHLYCMERFLNFPEICNLQNVDVRADTRSMPRESESRNKAALSGEDAKIALGFINACRKGRLSEYFPGYPRHRPGGQPKYYPRTLSFAMQLEINNHRAVRGRTNFIRHNGDVELYTKFRETAAHAVQDKKRKVLHDALEEVYDETRTTRENTSTPSGFSNDGRPLEECKKVKLSNHDGEAQDNDLDLPKPQSRGASISRSPKTEHHDITVRSPKKRQHSEVEGNCKAEGCKRVKIF